ncbi:MAG: heme ABC transporter permease CcmC [Pseudomonadota bacterium]
MKVSGEILPWLIAITCLTLAIGVYLSFQVPPDNQHGYTILMMFVHVPMSWLAMMAYTLIFISSIGYLVWRHPMADVAARSAVLIGACFTLLALITGALWGKPGWNTYWQWQEPRIVSVLILFFLYLGLIALRAAIEDKHQARIATALLAIVGFVIVPIIKFSVDWWATLHQPASILRLDGPSVHSAYLLPLLMMALAFTLWFFVLYLLSMRNEIRRQHIEAAQFKRVHQSLHS